MAFHLTAESTSGRRSFIAVVVIAVVAVGESLLKKVALCLHAQAQAPLARRTRAPTRACVCSSGRASAVTAA